MDEILKCDHSNESYRAVLSCSAVNYMCVVHLLVILTFKFVDDIPKNDHLNEGY